MELGPVLIRYTTAMRVACSPQMACGTVPHHARDAAEAPVLHPCRTARTARSKKVYQNRISAARCAPRSPPRSVYTATALCGPVWASSSMSIQMSPAVNPVPVSGFIVTPQNASPLPSARLASLPGRAASPSPPPLRAPLPAPRRVPCVPPAGRVDPIRCSFQACSTPGDKKKQKTESTPRCTRGEGILFPVRRIIHPCAENLEKTKKG